jgi:hypothetical protein
MTIQIREQNCTTGEIIDRDMTSEELDARKENKTIFDNNKKQLASAAEAKAALLDRLGITAEEAQLLLS